MMMEGVLFLLAVLSAPAATPADLQVRAEETLRKSLAAMTVRQCGGGWGTSYAQDDSVMWGEYRPVPRHWITVQPPATPGVAGIFLGASETLRDPALAEPARAARNALARIMTPEGGFPHEGPVDREWRKRGTFDDDVTTGALRFLIAWRQYTNAEEDLELVRRVGEFLLLSQYENGGWPQAYPPGGSDYDHCITLNDNAMVNVIRALLRLYELLGDARYLEAAHRGGACILRLQGGPGEAAWAQQYDPETLKPAWARTFEPPGYTPAESAEVCEVLAELYLVTGEDRFLEPLPRAFAWYEESRLQDGKWARLYEPGTHRPIYGHPKDRVVVYDAAGARGGYSWRGEWYPYRAKALYEEIRSRGRDAVLREQAAPESPGTRAELAERVAAVCDAITGTGEWLSAPADSERAVLREFKANPDQMLVHTSVFVHNARILLDYLEAQ
ncbi:MAG: hypothetical protein KA184_01935 [Candidatus Hydrogenedentes bacterium]|nr:hypothetical protein [Candidatus Hydrogenedentota bacterium]